MLLFDYRIVIQSTYDGRAEIQLQYIHYVMKIYFITSKLNFFKSGGSIEEFDLMMRTLVADGHQVVCVTTFAEDNDIQTELPYTVVVEDIPWRSVHNLQRGVYRIMKKYEHDADFFHVDGHLFLYGAGCYRRMGGKVPVSAFFNRELGFFPADRSTLLAAKQVSLTRKIKKILRDALERTIGMYLARAIDLRSFISPMYQAMYERSGLYDNGRHFVMGDPIDFPLLMSKNQITEQSYVSRTDHEGPVQLFFSSRMAPGKGFDLILAGFARVKDKERYRLILGGTGPEEAAIHKMAEELDIMRYITFPGWMTRDDLYAAYKKADVFIQIGWRPEGTSISLLYAMAFGLPSIVPKESGLAWQAGGSALHITNGDHDSVARAIEQLGTDAALRKKLSGECFVRLADEQMDHKKVIAKWEREMRSISEGTKSAS
jgi:glycosyltransferase involved in cell wall biosynthesis